MSAKSFYLAGENPQQGIELDISQVTEFSALQEAIASHFGIVVPVEVGFQDKTQSLDSLNDVQSSTEPIGITITGQSVRETPGPEGVPYLGSYLQSKLISSLILKTILTSISKSSPII